METSDPFDAELWRQGAELGWTAMLVPEAYGGGSVTEQPMVDLVVLAEELGRALNPGPFVPTNVVADAIARFGSEEQAGRVLARAWPAGRCTAAWCLSGDGSPEPGAVEVQARPDGNGWRLDGVSRYVHGAARTRGSCSSWRPARRRGATFLVARPSPGSRERTLIGLDLTRRFAEVRFDGVACPAATSCAEAGRRALEGSAVVTAVPGRGHRAPGGRVGRCGRGPLRGDRRVRQAASAVRSHHRQLPGDQAPAGRPAHGGRGDAGGGRVRRPGSRRRHGRRAPRRWRRRAPTSTTPSPTSAVRRSSSTGASGSPGSTTCISSCAGPRSTRCSTATAPGTASGWSAVRGRGDLERRRREVGLTWT